MGRNGCFVRSQVPPLAVLERWNVRVVRISCSAAKLEGLEELECRRMSVFVPILLKTRLLLDV